MQAAEQISRYLDQVHQIGIQAIPEPATQGHLLGYNDQPRNSLGTLQVGLRDFDARFRFDLRNVPKYHAKELLS